MKLETSDDLKDINEENKKLYSELTKLTGKNISSPADVGDVYGTLKSEVNKMKKYLSNNVD